MKKVVIFETDFSRPEGSQTAEEQANKWLKEHVGCPIINFTYQANVALAANEYGSGTETHQSICILYDTVMTVPH